MPARKPKESEVFVDPIDAMRELQEFEVGQFFDEVSPTVSIVHFHRMYPDGRRPQIGKAPLELIREDVYEYVRTTFVPRYGGGKYLMVARGNGSKFIGSRMIEVDGLADGATQQSHNGNGSSGYTTQPEEKLPFHDRLLLYQMMRQPQPALDIGAMMMGLAAIMSAMKPAEAGKPADPLEMVKAVMGMYNDLRAKNERDPLKELREVAGVIKEFTPEGNGKDPDSMWGAVASIGKDVVTKGSEVLSQFAAARTPPVMAPAPAAPVRFIPQGGNRSTVGLPPGPPAPQPQPAAMPPGMPEGTVMIQPAAAPVAPVAGTAPTTLVQVPMGPTPPAPSVAYAGPLQTDQPSAVVAGSQEDNIRRWLTIHVQALKQKAKAGKDPEAWIDYHFDNEEEPGVQAVFYAIRQGATFENLISFDPEIGNDVQLAGWFRALYEGIRNGRWVDGQFEPGLLSNSMDSRRPGGDSRDDSSNAVVSAPGPQPAGNSGASVLIPDTDIH